MSHTRTVYRFPEILEGYALDMGRGWWSVIVPKESTNLIGEPSFENYDITSYDGDWTAAAGVLSFTADYQTQGARCAAVALTTADAGRLYYPVTLTSGVRYSLSFDFRTNTEASSFRVFVSTSTTPTTANSRWNNIEATQVWHRHSLIFDAPSTGTFYIHIARIDGDETSVQFFVDAVQLEVGRAPTTYFDGDTQPTVPDKPEDLHQQPQFYWTATPHASPSVRTDHTRAGGEVIPLSDYGWLTKAVVGLGMASVLTLASPYGIRGGSQYQTTTIQERDFSIVGRISGESFADLSARRAGIISLLDPLAMNIRQPLVLRYQPTDECGDAIGHPVDIPAIYMGGLEGSINSRFQQEIALNFRAHFPYVRVAGRQQGAALEASREITGRLNRRTHDGVWTGIDYDLAATGAVSRARYGPDGALYALHHTASPSLSPTRLVRLKAGATSWETLHTSAASTIIVDFVVTPDWKIGFINYDITTPATGVLGLYDIRAGGAIAFSSPTGGFEDGGGAIAVAPNGDIWITRRASIGGASNVFRYRDGTWTPKGGTTGAGLINSMVVDGAGRVYVTGSFSGMDNSSGSVSAGNIAMLPLPNESTYTWVAMASGLDDDPTSGGTQEGLRLAVGVDGRVYVAGDFEGTGNTADVFTRLNNIAIWNGAAFESIGGGANDRVLDLFPAPGGRLYAFGDFSEIGGIESYGNALWTQGRWRNWIVTTNSPANNFLHMNIDISRSGEIVLVQNVGGAAGVAGHTLVVNSGTAEGRPVFRIRGEGTIYSIINHTSQNDIYFDGGMRVYAGETITLDFSGLRPKMYSDTRGDITQFIAPTSRVGNWRVLPGSNHLEVFMLATGELPVEVDIYWDIANLSIDTIVPLSHDHEV